MWFAQDASVALIWFLLTLFPDCTTDYFFLFIWSFDRRLHHWLFLSFYLTSWSSTALLIVPFYLTFDGCLIILPATVCEILHGYMYFPSSCWCGTFHRFKAVFCFLFIYFFNINLDTNTWYSKNGATAMYLYVRFSKETIS